MDNKHKYDGKFHKFPFKLTFGYSSYNAYYRKDKKGYFVKLYKYDIRTASHYRILKKYYYKTSTAMQKKVRQMYRTKRWNMKKKSKAKTKRRK